MHRRASSPRHYAAHHPRSQSGVALVESMLWISLVLMPLLLLMSETSRALADYRLIVQQVQTAARFLSTQEPGQGHAQARCLFLTGYPSVDCREPLLRSGFADVGFSLRIADASNQDDHRAQQAGIEAGGTVLVNLVSVTASGYRHQPLSAISASVSQLAVLGFAPIAATYRQMD